MPTTISKMPEHLINYLNCRLLHSRTPIATGKMVWNDTLKQMIPEIIWICKEGCNNEKSV